MIKINVDASVSPSSSCVAAMGRDSTGQVLLISAKPVNSTEPLLAEAEVILLGLQLTIDRAGERRC